MSVLVLTPTKDATMSEGYGQTVPAAAGVGNIQSGTSTSMFSDKANSKIIARRMLMAWDVSSIAGMPVSAASVVFTLISSNGVQTGESHRLAEITSSWTETAGTNNSPGLGTTYSVLKDFASAGYGSATSILALVQAWVDGTITNHGMYLGWSTGIDDNDFLEFATREHGTPASRPTLTITYNAPPPTPGVFTAPVGGSVFNTTHTVTHGASVDPEGTAVTYRMELSVDNGASWPYVIHTADPDVSNVIDFTSYPSTTTAKLRVRATDGVHTSAWRESSAFTIQHNQAPTAATPTFPVGNAAIDRNIVNRFTWTFNDPDAGDSKSKHDIRYRLVGAGAWTTILNQVNANNYHDFAGGTFAAGEYEWQVLTYDALGVVATGWSASAFFTALDPPAAPGITAPADGSTVALADSQVVWTAPDQDAYQVRRVADLAGAPDVGTVYYDSGTVVSTTDRNRALQFLTNNRYEHIQVRIRVDGLWSTWASVRVLVSYTPPPIPTLVLTEDSDNGRMVATITNPVPGGSEPVLAENFLYRRIDGEEDWERIAVALADDGTYHDYHAASGVAYEYMVRAVGVNGTYSDSIAYTAPLLDLRGSWIHDPADPDGTIYQFRYNTTGGSDAWAPELGLNQFAGRLHPVAEFGESEDWQGGASIQLDGRDEVDVMRALAARKTTLCYRDRSGRKVFGVIPSLRISSNHYGGMVNVDVIATSYTEEV